MLQEKVIICNKLGLHARAAAKFVGIASEFGALIEIEKDNKRVNGKSIMGVMMLAASKGSEIIIYAEGDDAQSAVKKLTTLVLNKFGEDE
jgi:phosphocarrier protein